MIKKAIFFFLGITISLSFMANGAQASVNDFIIKDYKIDYTLGRDTEKRSTLTTTETIIAEFPQSDQNHGIERAIPKEYQNHSVDLRIVSVKDEDGNAWNYTTYDDDEFEVVRIGDKDKYVHGLKTFIITYTQRDVTEFFANTQRDEFYWDTNGTDWKVPIEHLSVTLRVDDSMKNALTGDIACYEGRYSIDDPCELKQQDNVFTVEGRNLDRYENITIAVGFKPGTFTGYKMTLFETLFAWWIFLQIRLVVISVVVLFIAGIIYYRRSNRISEQKPIVPEYIPPKDISVSTAANLIGSSKGFAAQLVDLAVRHYLKIYEVEKDVLFGIFGKRKDYEIEVVRDLDDLRDEEKEVVTDIFGRKPSVGERYAMGDLQSNTAASARIQDNTGKTSKLVSGEYVLRNKVPEKSRLFSRSAIAVLVLAVLLLSPVLLVLALILGSMGAILKPLTDKGLAAVRYIKGLEMYIKVAEQDRLRMLQSPEGAAKVAVDTADGKQLVTLYERVLPYAILFGQEKQWNKQLGKYYESTGQQPDWYTGANMAAFSAASFSNALSSFSSSAASSSSSGGSSGGGSSGGGGGGGGGGGW
jgi:uncharacterized membrane protein YgcG